MPDDRRESLTSEEDMKRTEKGEKDSEKEKSHRPNRNGSQRSPEELRSQTIQRLHRRYGNANVQRLAARAGTTTTPGNADHSSDSPAVRSAKREHRRDEGYEVSPEVGRRISEQRGSGEPLESEPRREMEARFGERFRDVRIHQGSEAHRLNRETNAEAFTSGTDIFFRRGRYDPDSYEGKALLAHELTHTVESRGNELDGSWAVSAGEIYRNGGDAAGTAESITNSLKNVVEIVQAGSPGADKDEPQAEAMPEGASWEDIEFPYRQRMGPMTFTWDTLGRSLLEWMGAWGDAQSIMVELEASWYYNGRYISNARLDARVPDVTFASSVSVTGKWGNPVPRSGGVAELPFNANISVDLAFQNPQVDVDGVIQGDGDGYIKEESVDVPKEFKERETQQRERRRSE